MEIKFKDKLKYQQEAINSVVDLFKGHSKGFDPISIQTRNLVQSIEGYSNLLDMDHISIEENFKKIQKNNNIPPNSSLDSYDFTIEMETGTGKTYVYLRTLLELNKQYGFSKFVIVVPSVAIKEGVKKTIDITRKHFAELYNDVSYTDFIFDSSNMNALKNFMEEDNIQIMIITIQAFNREQNKIRQRMENGVVPLNFITKSNPIVIIDEPQTTISTTTQKEAVSDLNPLFTLQYSATPKDTANLIYRLDAIDAYNGGLVKKIEVSAFDAADYRGKPYIKLIETKLNKRNGERTAILSLVKNTKTGLNTAQVKIKIGDDLSVKKISDNTIYENYMVSDISVKEGEEYVSFENGEKIHLNQSINDINQEAVRKAQIEETIREHLNKEIELAEKNIKVLSLFFIDHVENYRFYDEEGQNKGKYARWFEEAYKKVIAEDKYKKLPKHILGATAEEVHNGYFSIDKKKWSNTSGATQKDESTYELIMKDKEKLLNPKNNLRFIFSHSTLKEGWDNPNVFQICTFIETQSDLSKRQKIGRGLRLCVDGDGNRIDETYGEDYKKINKLTVLANESFDSFAKSLQSEMEADGIRFKKIKPKDFLNLTYFSSNGEDKKFNEVDAERIWKSLLEQKLINKGGVISKQWNKSVIEGTVEIPEKYIDAKERIIEIVSGRNGEIISNKKDRVTINLVKDKLDDKKFTSFWDKIKYKTRYKVKFNSEDLIEKCVKDMERVLKTIEKPTVNHTKTEVKIKTGIEGITRTNRHHFIDVGNTEIPNIVHDLQQNTHLTKKTIIEILQRSNKENNTFEKLLINPTEYYNKTLEIIKDNLNNMIVDEIEYYILKDQEFSANDFKESFEDWVHDGNYEDSKLVKTNKSLYDYIKCDSINEVRFAKELENMDDIEFFLKLPNWFKIKTPKGNYNPDWAITLNIEGRPKNYFAIETKGMGKGNREIEEDKIKCAKKHFDLISDVEYDVCVDFDDFANKHIKI